ncbi:YwdI family protein [Parageobacillus sp. VR-IP]|jgi:hypothetical protein|nr:YwdI family protein [Parageobacillus sp. VR-IP]OQP04764.1 hypothetical protein BSK33_02195 [Geobacillus sp. 44B]QNU38766.1 YwdI family protein [Geobacillus sp. 44B]
MRRGVNTLAISIATILAKMEEELQRARTAGSPQRVREHIAAVRALCDLVLEEEEKREMPAVSLPEAPPLLIRQEKGERIDIGDDANGPSLFDF